MSNNDDDVLIAQIRKNEGDAAADAAARLFARIDESPHPTQEQMDAEELYRLAHWLHQNRDDTRSAGEPVVDWAIRNITTAERKLAAIKAIAANDHIGGMSVPMSDRLIAIIDNTEKGI